MVTTPLKFTYLPLLLLLVLFATRFGHCEALNGNGLWVLELCCSGGRHDSSILSQTLFD